MADYYRKLTDSKSNYDPEKGELVYVHDISDNHVMFFHYGSSRGMNAKEFFENFELAPNGKKERAKQLIDAMDAVESMGDDQLTPVLPPSETLLLGGSDPSDSKAVAVIGTGTANSLRTNLADSKRAITRMARSLEDRQNEIKGLLEEKKSIASLALKKMQKQVALFEDAIFTVNLYLGTDEEIVLIQDGDPAPPDARIAIHQETLFMDEETAFFKMLAEEGGLDYENIKDFDKWLLSDPQHLQAVLPEPKGIRVFRPRREDKDYSCGDTSIAAAFMNAAKNKANMESYFLIRNGSKLYRIWTPLKVPLNVFPSHQEYEEFFKKTEWDWETSTSKEQHIRPGTSEFQEAMDRANDSQRRYLKILLLLQGLLDRTDIFAPLDRPRVNVMNSDEYYGTLEFIRDGEFALGYGKPSFSKWLKELNGGIDVGQRIVGYFGYGMGSREEPRVSPKTAPHPESKHVYTLSQHVGRGRYSFLYERKDTIYTRYSSGAPQRRASCWIDNSDTFFLAIDRASVEDLEWFTTSRKDRHSYLTMIPLMKIALRFKEQEKQEEAPFRTLLISYISRETETAVEEVEPQIDELISWWKFKNKTHRALSSDDAKVVRMLLAEFKLRRRRGEERQEMGEEGTLESVSEAIRRAAPYKEYLLIAHKDGNEYKALVRANSENVFVHEETWKTNRGVPRFSEVKEWEMVSTKKISRWETLYTAPVFSEWSVDVIRDSVFSDPDLELAKAQLWERLENQAEYYKDDNKRRDRDGYEYYTETVFEVLAIVLREDRREGTKLVVWANIHKVLPPDKRNIPDLAYLRNDPTVERIEYKISNKKGNVVVSQYGSRNSYCNTKAPWKGDTYNKAGKILFVSEDNIAAFESFKAESSQIFKDHQLRKDQLRAPEEAVSDFLKARFYAAHKERFIQDGGLEEDWEESDSYGKGPKSKLTFNAPRTDITDRVVFLFHKGYTISNFNGMVTDELYTVSDGLGYAPVVEKEDPDDFFRWHNRHNQDTRPIEKIYGVPISIPYRILHGKAEDDEASEVEADTQPEPESVETDTTETIVENTPGEFEVLPPE